MELQDKVLKCIDCSADFVFTAGEQLFFREKQFKNQPKRCKSCKSKRSKLLATSPFAAGSSRIETPATCSRCGRDTTVPFRPTQGRPVLCRDCFQSRPSTVSA